MRDLFHTCFALLRYVLFLVLVFLVYVPMHVEAATIGSWQSTVDFPNKGHPYPSFSRGGFFYVNSADGKVYIGKPGSDGNITSWQNAWAVEHGGVHGFTAVAIDNTAFMFRNGNIGEYVFNADGTIAGNDFKFYQPVGDLNYAFEGHLWVWDTAVYAPLTTGKFVYHLGGFSCPGGGCAVSYQFNGDIFSSKVPIGNKFTKTGKVHPAGQSGKSVFYAPNGSSDHGFIFTVDNKSNALYRIPVNSDGSLGNIDRVADIPDGTGNKKGDMFVAGNTLFAIRGMKVFSTEIDPASGSLAGWNDNPPDLPEDQVVDRWSGGFLEGASWGIIGNYVYVTGDKKVFFAQINGAPSVPIPTTVPGVCQIRGYKVPAGGVNDGLVMTLKDVNGNAIIQTSGQPYFFQNLLPNTDYIVETAGNGTQTAGSTVCVNGLDCHGVADATNPAYAAGVSRRVTCPSDGYVDMWWHYVDPHIVPTPTPPAGIATVKLKIQTPDGRPVAVPYMYSLECIDGVHDCNAINFCRHVPPLQRYASEFTFSVATGGNICKTGAGLVLDTLSQQYAGVNLVPGTHAVVDQWSVPNQDRIEYNIAWSGMVSGNTYDAVVTVDERIQTQTPTPSPTGVAQPSTGMWGTPDGTTCGNPVTSGQNYTSLYSQANCAGVPAYQMADAASVHPCSGDGSGTCYIVSGMLATQPAGSSRSISQPACVNKPVSGLLLPAFSQIQQCTWYPPGSFPVVATPIPTSTPQAMAWYAPDGSLCSPEGFSGRNYATFYTGSLCGGQAGYRMERIQPQTTCSIDGSGSCYKTSSTSVSFSASSMWWLRGGIVPDQQCVNIAPAVGVSDMYDSIIQCAWSGGGHQIPPTPTVSSCFNQQVVGDYNCDGSVTMKDFTDWLPDFLQGTTTLPFFEYWRRVYIGSGPVATLTPTPPGYISPTNSPIATNTPRPAATTIPVSTPTPTVVSPITCPTSSSNTYDVIDREASYIGAITYPSGDPVPANHPDLNLSIRGFSPHTASAGMSGGTPVSPLPPQFGTMFRPGRMAQMIKTYRVFDWNWDHSILPFHGTKGALLSNREVTLLGVAAHPGEVLFAPYADYHIGENVPTEAQVTNPYQTSILYVDNDRITLTYTRNDTVSGGYTVHVEDICVDPNLVLTYRQNGLQDPANRGKMIVLRSQRNPKTGATNTGAVAFGVAKSGEVKVAIRTGSGTFDDPRWLNWWQTQ